MAFVQYLVFDGARLPLPDSYEVQMDDVEADSGGETEAGTTQRDVVRLGVVSIQVSFSVSPPPQTTQPASPSPNPRYPAS